MPSSTTLEPREIVISVPSGQPGGTLTVPQDAKGIVLFAQGSGSTRFSPRSRYVAEVLQAAGLATLLVDLLTRDEDAIDRYTRQFQFDIGLLSERLTAAIDWLTRNRETRDMSVGLFGASTGAAAALRAAAARPDLVRAVVSRGGRPDLAGRELTLVRAPTLLIVGAEDIPVIPLNKSALRQLQAPATLTLVPGATHLFEESGTLATASGLARDWFLNHLSAVTPDATSRTPGQ